MVLPSSRVRSNRIEDMYHVMYVLLGGGVELSVGLCLPAVMCCDICCFCWNEVGVGPGGELYGHEERKKEAQVPIDEAVYVVLVASLQVSLC